jgi:methylmalonyl-CoA mutase N-terminal domain/subunit
VRAARRMWARIAADRFGADDVNSGRLRFFSGNSGTTLTAQQPLNNIVRSTIQCLGAVLGGAQSIHVMGYDEAYEIPSEEAVTLSLRTQQIVALESGVPRTVDPLGGSYYVEALTDELEAAAERIFAQIIELGGGEDVEHAIGPVTSGLLRGIEEGWFTSAIADAAFAYQTMLEKGEKKIVGVNVHTATVSGELEILRVSHEVELAQRELLAVRRAARDDALVGETLADLRRAAQTTGENLVPPMLAAARAEATLGEICDVLRDEWGTYTETARF